VGSAFDSYFAEDMKLLAPLAKDGLVEVDEERAFR
jgi:oxygen-independent coproporphyrinogen-3 oxidase